MKKEAERTEASSIMEGMISIRSVLEGGHRKILRVLYSESRAASHAKEINFLKKRGADVGFDVICASDEDISALAIGTSHGGIIAQCSERTLPPLSEDKITGGFWVMLDGIEDPYNFGYCLRSLYAAGVNGIIVSPRNWMSAAGVVCRASAGASELFDIYTAEISAACKMMKGMGFSVVAADKSPRAASIYDTEVEKPVFLLVGGEKRGIAASAASLVDKTVMLDYGRDFPAALSAASAASVLAFEIFRKGRNK